MEKKLKGLKLLDHKRIFCSTKGKKKMFSWQTGRTNRVIWKYLLKKKLFCTIITIFFVF